MFQNKEKKEEQEQFLSGLIDSTSKVNTCSNDKILTTQEQVVVYELLISMNKGKDASPLMRPELAIKQLGKMKEEGIDINLLYNYLNNK